MRWLRRLFRQIPDEDSAADLVEDKQPCPLRTRHTHPDNDGKHWANENTAAFPVNRARMTPGMQYRGHGGRWPV
jgi:hypothetical protein